MRVCYNYSIMINYVFGDTGGHGSALLASLEEIGFNRNTLELPEGVRVIHLGDLIHKGPDSNALLPLVDAIIDVNPGRWVQLLGNHEFQHIKGSPSFWRCDCDSDSKFIINNWWESKKAFAAFALNSFSSLQPEVSARPSIIIPQTSILFTHSGITRPFWKEMGASVEASVIADAINASPVKVVSRPGEMLFNPHAPNHNPGPVWALSSGEVFASWTDTVMPFIQVHGHTTAYGWMYKRWFPGTSKWFKDSTKLNPENRVSITEVAESILLGVDPGFNERIDLPSQPFLTIETD